MKAASKKRQVQSTIKMLKEKITAVQKVHQASMGPMQEEADRLKTEEETIIKYLL